MHAHSIEPWTHDHAFLGERHDRNERRMWAVVELTAAMMLVEMAGGTIVGSMALVGDGWHMTIQAAALGIAGLAYRFARRHAHNRRFSFGTGKPGELAGFASAMILGMVALYVGVESTARLLAPVTIGFDEAIPIAVVGLAVNVVCAWLLRDDHHGHDHQPGHRHGSGDTNFRAAYMPVLADALTSVLAIVALLGGAVYGWHWLDPMMWLVAAGVIAVWPFNLTKSAGAVLLDAVPAREIEA